MEFYPICDETLALSPNLWYAVSGSGEIPFMRVGHTIIQYKDKDSAQNDRGSLIVIGGANPSECFKEIYTLDLKTLIWNSFKDTKNFETGRYEHACFQSTNNEIYIFGGANQEKNLNDVIKFNIEKKSCENIEINQLIELKPEPRTIHCGVTFKNQLVIFGGGQTGSTAVPDSKVYIFNPIHKKWINLSIKGVETPSIRHGHLMINFNDEFIYLHGGMNENKIYDDFWKLDLSKMSWEKIDYKQESKSKPPGRAAHGGIASGKYLYIFGGIHENGSALDDLWKYDTELYEWTMVEVFGYKPPARLDFAYCKLSYLSKEIIKPESECSENNKDSANTNLVNDLILNKNIQELNLLEGKVDVVLESNKNGEKVENQNQIENSEKELTEDSKYKSEKSEKNEGQNIEEESAELTKLVNVLVIHGGMDTEGNVYDDCFFINIE